MSLPNASETPPQTSTTCRDLQTPTLQNSLPRRRRNIVDSLGELSGQECFVQGMVLRVREFKAHSFIMLRDRSGDVQVVIAGGAGKAPPPGSFIEIHGKVVSSQQAKRGYEIQATDFRVLGSPQRSFPLVLDQPPKESLEIRLDNRAISLRNSEVVAAFRLQALVGAAFRESLMAQGFTEIHTPKFVDGGTEGGASVFSVKYFDKEVSLAQSPQLYKQIGAGALERVFEIGAVYRAENSTTSRHLTEFTGLDYEMAFIRDEQEIIDVEERFILAALEMLRSRGARDLQTMGVELPVVDSIPRISYQEAHNLIIKHGAAGVEHNFDKAIGDAVLKEFGARFVFVCDYPVTEKPFYIMPHESIAGATRSFDLIFDGLEISSGGQRIHDYATLRGKMQEHGLYPEQYKGYLQAFEYGMPPHGGAGLGLERVTQRFLGLDNVREVCMFPRDPKRTTP